MAAMETITVAAAASLAPSRTVRARNWPLMIGLAIFGLLLLVGVIGPHFLDEATLEPGSVGFSEKPSLAHPLGTDGSGRDLLTFMVYGIVPSLIIGFIAGTIGTAIGSFLGLAAGYLRGPVDTVVRTLADIMLTIPSLIILIVIASFVRTTTIELMALIISIFAWPFPARTIRSQTLSMRELAFVKLAKLSGRGDLSIIVRDLLPNLLPFIGAAFVGSVSGAVLASVGLQLLGLGPPTTPTIGLVLESAFEYGAVVQGLWWWWGPPTIMLIMLFIGLFLISVGMDRYANPRLRRKVA
jgi:peptide/nickel transport system permease protein